jgi:hypothetical protein
MAKNISGLIPFKPGQSGNPNGRPKKTPITDEYEKLAGKKYPETLRISFNKKWKVEVLKKGATYAEANAAAKYLAGINGDTAASKEFRESIEGKAKVRVELTGESGGPIQQMHVHYANMTEEELKQLDEKLRAVIETDDDALMLPPAEDEKKDA